MRYTPFRMERWQSTYENRVAINLSESGVHPMTVAELLALAERDDGVDQIRLAYGQSNGSDELRERVAALYPGASEASVLVTVGGAEANFVGHWHLLQPDRPAAIMLPNYMQVPGMVENFGAPLIPFNLLEETGWQPDLDQLKGALEAGATFILVTNPNNPTGACLTAEAMDGITALADQFGAWILSDEVYCGAEVSGEETPSFWDRTDRVVVTNSLSKAYGLPGLRLGWVVGPEELIKDLWGRTDYTTISPATLSDHLATIALDQISKYIVMTSIEIHRSIPVISGFFDLVHTRNRGMAFGMFNRPGSDLGYYLLLSATFAAVFSNWRATPMPRTGYTNSMSSSSLSQAARKVPHEAFRAAPRTLLALAPRMPGGAGQ